MKIIFFGTPQMAVPSLEKITASGLHQVDVATSCDKPKGRGLKVCSSPVREFADARGLKVFQPVSVKDPEFIKTIKAGNYDAGVVVSYGQILPEELIRSAKYGYINSHFSLLPKYRGAAPINAALINNEKYTGISVIFVEKKLDTGDIILSETEEIKNEDDAGSLSKRLSEKSGSLLLKALDQLEKGKVKAIKQGEKGASYAPKITSETARINWKKNAIEIVNLVRGLSPAPSAFFSLNSKKIAVIRAKLIDDLAHTAEPGTVIQYEKGKGLIVAAGKGKLLIETIKPESKKEMSVDEFMRGFRSDDFILLK